MKISVTSSKGVSEHDGDPIDVMPGIMSKIVDALYHGDSVDVTVLAGDFDWCGMCLEWTANHEPRRKQVTRRSRGYFTCPVCGYMKEGVTPGC